ncbi:PREDICTED: B3 domain-containing protein REM13-like isoform X2 [Brassica oleracea var. oleracea]|uniref:B3 domain-containing protein REM13-like isoform X2 n=1 Tax=Brassica oleracea var. oleracea TaxID=109376 RepID=UPI0006A73C28|nr:PREDICTED: B3 domain-containing protein REM13-like isoform X2 [Brassica oleracea var. oleracea]
MAKSRLLRPQFFHTLVPGFHTHLMIPEDFFSKYIEEGRSMAAELISDASDKKWRLKMTGRRLGDGWREFAVDNNLRFGGVLLVRYEGDMVFHVSNLGQNCCEIQDISPPCNKFDKTLLKKRLHPRTQVDRCDEDEDGIELPRNKKTEMRSPEAEAEPLSSSSDNSCFVALVTASSLRTDKLYLPQHITSSNGLTRKCRKIVLVDGGERSWTLDLSFNKSSDTFCMSRGWRNFCEENGQEPGGFFMFKLVGNRETPVLSLGLTESNNDTRVCSQASERESLSTELSSEDEYIQGESSEDDCSSMESLMETGKKKCSPKRRVTSYASYSSYLPYYKRYVTFTLRHGYATHHHTLSLPALFVRENGINKPGEIHLLGKDGTKWPTSLLVNIRGSMSLGKGWKDFVKANGVESGFTLKLMWEDTTPVFCLCSADSTSDREQEEYFKAIRKQSLFMDPSNIENSSKDEKNKEENMSWERKKRGRGSTPLSLKQFVTLTITPCCFITCRLVLPAQFARENSLNKLRMIYLLGRDGRKWLTKIHQDKKGRMSLGKGWKDFVEANNFKSGDSFAMELIWEDGTRMLRLSGAESSSSKAYVSTEAGSSSDSSSSAIQNRSVTLTLTPEEVRACKLHLPSEFMKANGINRLGKITLLGANKMEWSAYLLTRDGTVALGIGWDEFCEANGVSLGESFTLEFSKEQNRTTPVLKFCSLETNKKVGKC